MKILALGGMHGNEPLGPAVVTMIQEQPIENVATLLANEQAIAKNCRFVDKDLNRSFPGQLTSEEYEPRRAAELLPKIKGYDVVLDFHNTYCPGNDCGFVGVTANTQLYEVAWLLGLDKVIVADYDCVNKYAPNCLSVEISLSSQLNNAEIWYALIKQLSRLEKFRTKPIIEKFRFVYRMTLEDKVRLTLDKVNLNAFAPISPALAKELGVDSPAYPIFIADKYTPYNYGGILNKLE